MTANARFEFIFTGNSSGLKQAAAEAKEGLASVRQEAARTAPAFDAQAEASDRAAMAAREFAEATAAGASVAQRNIAAITAAADAALPSMDRLVNAFAGISAPAANRNGRAADIEAYGRELDRLQAKFNPLFAAQQRYQEKLREIAQAERVGAISASAAIDLRIRERNSYDALTDSIDRAGRARKAAAQGIVARQTITPDRGADITAFLDQRDQVRAKYNPVFAVLSDYKVKLEEIREANRAGALTADEMSAAISRQRQAALGAVAAIKGREGAGGGAGDRFRLQNLGYQGFDIGQSLIGGMPLGMIAAQQGPQIAQMYAGQGGTSAFLKDIQTLATGASKAITPLTVGISALAVVVTTGALAYDGYLKSTKEVETAASGLGRATAGGIAQMEAAAHAGASAANISVSSARSMEAQFLRTGRIGSEHFEELIGLSKDFATTVGIDADTAGDVLAKMFADPAEAAKTLYQQYGLIDAATARQATNLARQNRQSEAQAVLLKALPDQLADAAEATTKLGRAWDWAGRMASNAFDWMGKTVDRAIEGPSLEERIAQAEATRNRMSSGSGILSTLTSPFGAADAFDSLNLEALRSEKEIADYDTAKAKREAEARARSVAVNNTADASGANSTTLRIESLGNEIQTLSQGGDGIDEARRTQALEAKTRVYDALINRQQRSAEIDRLDIQISNERNPLLRAELEARRTRLELSSQEISTTELEASASRARNRVIEETIGAAAGQVQDMQAEVETRTRLNALVANGAITNGDANRMLQEELTLRPLIAAAAVAEGEKKASLLKVISDLQGANARLAEQEKLASAHDYLRSGNERNEQLKLELSLIGASDEVGARAMARLEAEQAIRQRGLATGSALADQIRDQADANAKLNQTIERQADAWDKVRSAGESTIDSLVDNLSEGDFSGALEDVTKDLTKSILELGVKNPLKNAALGTNYGTLSDVGGFGGIISRLFGGGEADPAELVSNAIGQSVGAMTVTAGTVMINGGLGGFGGGMLGGASNDNKLGGFSGLAGAKPVQSTGSAVDLASGLLGFNENANNTDINAFLKKGGVDINAAQTKWCAGFVNSALAQIGVKGSNSLTANSFLDWGQGVDIGQALKGDVLVQSRGLGVGAAGGHVGFATGASRMFEGQQQLQMLSGNSSDSVGTSWINASELTIRRATEASAALGGMASNTNVAAQGLGTLGNGFNTFGNSLNQIQPGAAGSGGGLFGGLLGGIGKLFGGISPTSSLWAPNTTLGSVLVNGFADGGMIQGEGTGRSDSIIARVSNGEFIVNADATRRNRPLLEAVNSNRMRAFSDGGYVSSIAPSYTGAGATTGAASSERPTIKIVNNSSVPVSGEVEEGRDENGRRQWQLVMNDKMADAASVSGGRFDKTMGGRYGTRRRGVRRS